MVTGRELDELLDVCPEVELFDLVVAENGALLYDPRDGGGDDACRSASRQRSSPA